MSNMSTIPCCLCGGPVEEFSIPNSAWNHIVRKDGPETDKEYLCWSCFEGALVEGLRVDLDAEIVGLSTERASLRSQISTLEGKLASVEGLVQKAFDAAIDMAAEHCLRIGDYSAQSKADGIRYEAYDAWIAFQKQHLSTPKTEERTSGGSCTACGGSGEIWVSIIGPVTRICGTCNGSGFIPSSTAHHSEEGGES
jgi:hypothetical protein